MMGDGRADKEMGPPGRCGSGVCILGGAGGHGAGRAFLFGEANP